MGFFNYNKNKTEKVYKKDVYKGEVYTSSVSNREKNIELTREYPFLLPNINLMKEKYNYEYTKLDSLPVGWKKAFGEKLCKDIKSTLIKNNMLETYRINRICEEYGVLAINDNDFKRCLASVINFYKDLSEHTCVVCGSPEAVLRKTRATISPYCTKCYTCGIDDDKFNT